MTSIDDMRARGLTDKQREFARLMVGGVSKVEAYRQAYGKPNMTAAAARQAAHRLSHNVDVLAYCDTLRQQADADAVITRRERMAKLSQMAIASQGAGNIADAVRCIQELNRMDGAYEPERVEVRGTLGVAQVVAALQGNPLDMAQP